MNLVTVTIDLDTHAIVPIEPTFSILNAMASSTAKDDEGTFEPLMDLIGFSGENKTQAVLKQVWKDSVKAAPPYPEDNDLRCALEDLLSGWRYIRESYGDLYGVGWNRAQRKAEQALGIESGGIIPQELFDLPSAPKGEE